MEIFYKIQQAPGRGLCARETGETVMQGIVKAGDLETALQRLNDWVTGEGMNLAGECLIVVRDQPFMVVN